MVLIKDGIELDKQATEREMAEKVATQAFSKGVTEREAITPEVQVPEQPKPIDVVTPPTIEPQPTPEVIAPQIETPKVEEPKIEAPKIEDIKIPKPAEKIESAQDIKAKELANQATEDTAKATQEQSTLTSFDEAMRSGNLEGAKDIAISNPGLKKSFDTQVKAFIGNKSNIDFFKQYNGMSSENMEVAVNQGQLVPGSERYNLLPEGQRQAFEQYNNQKQNIKGTEKFDDSAGQKVQSLTDLVSEMKNLFSSDLRKNYNDLLNSDEINKTAKDLEDTKNDINKVDDELDRLEEDVREQYPNLNTSAQNAIIRDRQKNILREKNTLINEYNAKLGTYQSLKDTATQELEFLKYEDAQNKDLYMTALGLYETRRKEARADKTALERIEAEKEERQFLEDNRRLAAETQFENQKEFAKFQEKIKQENLSGGKYIDNGQGDLVYIKNGEEISVLKGLGKTISTTEDNNYSYQIKDNEDGSYSMIGTPKKDGLNPTIQTFGASGDKSTSWIKSTGTGEITGHGGAYDNNRGLDIDGNVGDPIMLQQGGKIIKQEGHPLFGNTVVVKLDDGNTIRYSHLQDSFGDIGDRIGKGGVIGTIGNTGNVLKMDGTKPTKAELKQGFGSHLDIVTQRPDGTYRTSYDTESYLNGLDNASEITPFVDDLSISTFNNSTFKPQNIKTAEEKANYSQFVKEKNEVMRDKNADIVDILKYSQGGKPLTDSTIESLTKFDSVISQLGGIQEQIAGLDTGPFVGKLAQLNPYNTDAQVLKAQLTALIPNLARGVYGEVGVLTDNDIRLYSKTIPNLTSTNEVNQAVLAMTLKVVAGGYKKQLQSFAAAGKDVSGYQGLYDNLIGQVDSLETQLGINNLEMGKAEGTVTTPTGFTFDYTKGVNQTQTDKAPYTGFFNN